MASVSLVCNTRGEFVPEREIDDSGASHSSIHRRSAYRSWPMRRYGLRDDQWDQIKNLLPGRAGTVGVTATRAGIGALYCRPSLFERRPHSIVYHVVERGANMRMRLSKVLYQEFFCDQGA